MKLLAAVLVVLGLAVPCGAQTVDLFRTNPLQYFAGAKTSHWVGNGLFFQVNYSDTLQFAPDSSGKGLAIRRVLVNADKGAAISRGSGQVMPVVGDSIYAVRWTEKSYPPVNGLMRWQEGQWVVSFDGEWKEWSIRVRPDAPGTLVAGLARMIPGFRPVELSTMTYRAVGK